MTWFRRVLKRGRTTIEGDTLKVEGVTVLDASAQTVKASTLEATTVQGTTVQGTTVQDAGGVIQNRRYIYESAAIDLSAASATVVGPIFPVAGQIRKAYYVVTEAVGAGENTTALQLGTADADGSSNGDADAHVLGTTDAANGLVTAEAAVGTVQDLTLGGADAGAIAAGKALTISHTQDSDLVGTVKVIVEYTLG